MALIIKAISKVKEHFITVKESSLNVKGVFLNSTWAFLSVKEAPSEVKDLFLNIT